MLAMIVAYVLSLVVIRIGVGTVATAEAHARWAEIMRLEILSRSALREIVMPISLGVLAAAQLLLLHQAAAAVQRPATLSALQHILWRRLWIGAIAFAAVLFVCMAYVHAFIYGLRGTPRLAVINDHSTPLFVGALGGITVVWLIAAIAPLYVLRRAIERAMKSPHAIGP